MGVQNCSLYAIRAYAEAGRKVPLCVPGGTERVAMLCPEDGMLNGIVTDTGWLVVNLPGKGLHGLPLESSTHCWHSAWENLIAGFEVKVGGEWREADDWSQVREACALN